MLRQLLATSLILAASMLPGAGFHGFSLEEIAATGKASAIPSGEVMLLPDGLREEALEAAAGGVSLEAHLALQGYEFIGAVGPDGALIVRRDGAKEAMAGRLVSLDGEHRLAASLRNKTRHRDEWRLVVHGVAGGGLVEAMESSFPDMEISGTMTRGRSLRVALRHPAGDDRSIVDWLSERRDVYSVMEAGTPRLYNATARRWVQSGTDEVAGETIWGRGIRGEGQVIATLDTGADWLNCHLAEVNGSPPPVILPGDPLVADTTRRKIIAYQILPGSMNDGAMDSQGHGTLVAGNALGAELNGTPIPGSTSHDGVAPAAKLVVQDGGYQNDPCGEIPALGCPVPGVLHFLEDARSLSAHIHNNSWGDQEEADVQNVYTNISADMDLMTWLHPDFLIVCAAGNSGRDGDDTVSSPSTGKNVLSIGATTNPDANSMAVFSSRGWTNDDRIKPDLVAPGVTRTAMWSDGATALHCQTRNAAGTSMASPVTAGAAALVRQYYTEGWYPSGAPVSDDSITSPSAALLRATLIAGAAHVTAEPRAPSRGQGWGRVHLEDALHFHGDIRRLYMRDEWHAFDGPLDDPVEVILQSSGNPQAGDIRFVLAWTDYPATAGADVALVNDLDLEVVAPDGTIYRGNNFDATTGRSLPDGDPDQRNTVEVVRVEPQEGVYTVRIHPANIIHGGQGFALVATGDVIDPATLGESDLWLVQ